MSVAVKNSAGVWVPAAGSVSNSYAPIGAIYPYGGSSAPSGYLMCDGSAVSRTDYSALFAVIGTSFGSGDGSTTFNIPDLRGKFTEGTPNGGTVGTSIAAGLPNITGTLQPIATDRGATGFEAKSGAFTNSTNASHSGAATSDSSYRATIDFNASKSNSIYGNSTTVQPPAVCVNYIIKAKDVNLSGGGQALADRVETLADRVETLETTTSGNISGATTNSGTITNATYARSGNVVQLRLTLTGASLTTHSANTLVVTMPSTVPVPVMTVDGVANVWNSSVDETGHVRMSGGSRDVVIYSSNDSGVDADITDADVWATITYITAD